MYIMLTGVQKKRDVSVGAIFLCRGPPEILPPFSQICPHMKSQADQELCCILFGCWWLPPRMTASSGAFLLDNSYKGVLCKPRLVVIVHIFREICKNYQCTLAQIQLNRQVNTPLSTNVVMIMIVALDYNIMGVLYCCLLV